MRSADAGAMTSSTSATRQAAEGEHRSDVRLRGPGVWWHNPLAGASRATVP
jgi:hypothetical protein